MQSYNAKRNFEGVRQLGARSRKTMLDRCNRVNNCVCTVLIIHRECRIDMLQLIPSEVIGLERRPQRHCRRIKTDSGHPQQRRESNPSEIRVRSASLGLTCHFDQFILKYERRPVLVAHIRKIYRYDPFERI
jgi:hypothetical protein